MYTYITYIYAYIYMHICRSYIHIHIHNMYVCMYVCIYIYISVYKAKKQTLTKHQRRGFGRCCHDSHSSEFAGHHTGQLGSSKGLKDWLVVKKGGCRKLGTVWYSYLQPICPFFATHGAGICTPTSARTKSPSHVSFYIAAPWVAHGYSKMGGYNLEETYQPLGTPRHVNELVAY